MIKDDVLNYYIDGGLIDYNNKVAILSWFVGLKDYNQNEYDNHLILSKLKRFGYKSLCDGEVNIVRVTKLFYYTLKANLKNNIDYFLDYYLQSIMYQIEKRGFVDTILLEELEDILKKAKIKIKEG